jgi:leucyl/phenylalanyl-tRNA--protein transferase
MLLRSSPEKLKLNSPVTNPILGSEVLLDAYCQGFFPMAEEGEILWFSPELRGIIPLDDRFHIPHGLERSLKKNRFEIRWNHDFRSTMRACSEREETWIDANILESYCALHELGFAHSVECWDADGLQGGLYGVAIGHAFFGESMFSRKTDASKIALVALVNQLKTLNFQLLDTQWMTEHLRQFGGFEMPRSEYLTALKLAIASEIQA